MSGIDLVGFNKRQRNVDGTYTESYDQVIIREVSSDLKPTISQLYSLGSATLLWLAGYFKSLFSGTIEPLADGTYTCGTLAKAWSSVHTYDITSNTSNIGAMTATTLNNVNLPTGDGTQTMLDDSNTATVFNKTLSTGTVIAADVLPDVTATRSLGSTANYFANLYTNYIYAIAGVVVDATNKIIAVATQNGFNATLKFTGTLAANQTVLIPTNSTSTDTVCLLNATQTLGNKTYSGGTFSPTTTTQSTTFAFTGAGATGSTSATVNVKYTLFGNWVLVQIPALSATNGGAGVSLFSAAAGSIPTAYRPTSSQSTTGFALSLNSVYQASPAMLFQSTGQIQVSQDPAFSGNIPASNAVATQATSLIYYIG